MAENQNMTDKIRFTKETKGDGSDEYQTWYDLTDKVSLVVRAGSEEEAISNAKMLGLIFTSVLIEFQHDDSAA